MLLVIIPTPIYAHKLISTQGSWSLRPAQDRGFLSGSNVSEGFKFCYMWMLQGGAGLVLQNHRDVTGAQNPRPLPLI